jgi:dihydrofolate synthase/folylpolyglutamate synthase
MLQRWTMTYPEAIQFLLNLRRFGATFGLANTLKLAGLAGDPQKRLRFIHVAGTNGKGSTCAMLESIYRAAGLRVGLFTSPHLIHFGERIQINRLQINENEIAALLDRMQPWLRQFSADDHPTFFEVVTVMALLYFAEHDCELVIWETGLGGRLDATNIVMPLASLITNIQLDHEKWLGESLESIAAEKAGIIKPGVPVLTAATEPEALAVIERTARERNSTLTMVVPSDAEQPPLDRIALPLAGQHQRMNAALAVATVQALQNVIPVTESQIINGLLQTRWAGRLQLITPSPGQKFLLDGAHNAAGALALRAALSESFPDVTHSLILGILEDKNYTAICETLAPLAHRILLVPVSSERSVTPERLVPICQLANPKAEVRAFPDLTTALTAAKNDPFVVITGSLYLIGEALEQMQNDRDFSLPGSNVDLGVERALNEWSVRVEPV